MSDWFGEWLTQPVHGRGIRLVVERMNETAERQGVAGVETETNPKANARRIVTGFEFDRDVEITSFRHQNFSETTWVRKARIEVLKGDAWETIVPSRWIDARHHQPCRWQNQVEELDSRFLPPDVGTRWTDTFYHDYLLRTIEPCGPGSKYPDWLNPKYILASAAPPAAFCYVYNPGDSGTFNALIAAILQPTFMTESQKLFPQLIDRFGFMPGNFNPGKTDKAFALDFSGNIWGPSCFWDLWSWSRDRDYLSWITPTMAKWSRWWLSKRDRNGDGWIEPGINASQRATPEIEAVLRNQFGPYHWPEPGYQFVGKHDPACSALVLAINECPWDDAPAYTRGRCRGFKFDPETGAVKRQFIESQLYNAGLADYCARAFAELGDEAQSQEFASQARRLESLVRDHHWDERSGFYYDRDVSGELRTDAMHAGGFYPMIHGIPTMHQARRMVGHLLDPKKFWSRNPVPTLAMDDPDYAPRNYWAGRAWPPTNFHILRGLIRYNFFDVADELLTRWLDQVRTCFDRPTEGRKLLDHRDASIRWFDMRRIHMPDCDIVVAENWNPETGEVNGSPGLSWGGLWLPAIIYRNFWPNGEHHAFVRPGGRLRFRQKDRWDVTVEGDRAEVNGQSIRMLEQTTYLLDCRNGQTVALPANAMMM